ncbi:MAG: hypothetical protein WC760_04720 [Bacteroidia bacterium]
MRFILYKVIILLLVCLPVHGMAQERPYQEPTGLNNWYVEAAGAGYLYSLNYEKILYRSTKWGWVGRVGIGYTPMDIAMLNILFLDAKTFMIPFTTSMLYGSRERKEKLEFGGGFTLLAKGIDDRETAYTGVIGFRVIETNKVCFRASYTPIITANGTWFNWFGVSLGMNFSLK